MKRILIVLPILVVFVSCAPKNQALNKSISSMNQEIVELQKSIADLKMENDELDRKITVNKSKINTNSQAISDINNDVTYLTNEVSMMKERLKTSKPAGRSGDNKSMAEDNKTQKAETGSDKQGDNQIVIIEDKFSDKGSLYSYAYELFKSGKYYESRKKFNEFLSLYPDDGLSDNAKYWVAETYYSQNDYNKAIENIKQLINKYSDGNKVPAGYLKMGLAYNELGNKTEAVKKLKELTQKFPASDAAARAKEFLAKWE